MIVIACGARKAATAAAARDLYVGGLFRAARAAAEADGRAWLICSAQHGLLHPDTVIAPYERRLARSRADITRLAGLIAEQRPPLAVEAWTPAHYTAALRGGGIHVQDTPLAGLGIGQQLAWLTRHRTATSPPEGPPMSHPELLAVDPRQLLTTANVRTDLRLDDGFLASVAAQGVLVPIVATRTDHGELVIEYGHRRAAAAVAAGLSSVPVVIMPPSADQATRLMAQLAENERRAALSGAERVAAHEQLALLGVSVADAARTLGETQDRVRAARKVAVNPVATAAAEAGMDLADALVLAEFDDDATFVELLLEVAAADGRDEMLREAERRRQQRRMLQAKAAEEDAWRARGYQIVDPTHGDDSVIPIWRILDPGGDSINDDDHQDCPGRAVKILRNWGGGDDGHQWRASHYCVDPGEHHPGQVKQFASSQPTRPEAGGEAVEAAAEAKAAERRRVIDNNKDWRAAEPVRRAHVKTWLATAKPTPAIARWLLGELLDPGPTRQLGDTRAALADLGWASDVIRPHTSESSHRYMPARSSLRPAETASQPRAVIGCLAWLLADRETDTSTESWRTVRPTTTSYLEFLEDHTGYKLGRVEQLAAGRASSTEDEPATSASHDPDGIDLDADDLDLDDPYDLDSDDPLARSIDERAGGGDPVATL